MASQETHQERHATGQAYSASNPVPNVKDLLRKQNDIAEQQLRSKVDEDHSRSGLVLGEDEKKKIMDQVKASKTPTNPAKELERRGTRVVRDPVTGQEVEIKDAVYTDYADEKLFSREALDPAKPDVKGPAHLAAQSGDNDPASKIAPVSLAPSNILLQRFPPPVPGTSLTVITSSLSRYALILVLLLLPLYYLAVRGRGLMQVLVMSLLLTATAAAIYIAHSLVARKLEKELEVVRWEMEKQRGELNPQTPESSEWLNSLLAVIWGQMNPDMFAAVIDTVEDVLQQSLPGFVSAVKINDFSLGQNALRIISMRGLPDQAGTKKDWIDQGQATQSADAELDDNSGSHVNLEIAFAYAVPRQARQKVGTQNISLLLEFYLGMYDLLHLPVPIWISVEQIAGTIRLRLQIISDPPFVRNCTVALMGVPAVEVQAIPMMKGMPNVLDLPFVSGLVKNGLAAATLPFVAPKSMTLNLMQILSGDGIKKDTSALGIIKIVIHHAVDLSPQDANGSSDPYVVVSFDKFSKPLYSTRIIPHDLNPVWEETALLLVTADEIRADESVCVQLWDADSRSADDLIGRVTLVSLSDIMLSAGKTMERSDPLMGYEDKDAMSGTINWSVTYYDKAALDPKLKKSPGIDYSLPAELQNRAELKVEESKAVDTAEQHDVQSTPPSSQYPSGILSIIVHQLSSLECQVINPGRDTSSREGEAGQDTDRQAEEANALPSAYVELIVNDNMIYKTRVKQYNSNPFIEAGTEVIVRNWMDTKLRVVVRDARLREKDPILGIVQIDLQELLSDASQVTRMFSIQEGVGYGRVRMSILFRAVDMKLPERFLGWDTGSVCVTSHVKVEAVPGTAFSFEEKRLVVSTLEAKSKLPGSVATRTDAGVEYDVPTSIRLPTYDRYASALFFDYGGGVTVGPPGKSVEAFAVLWLQDLVDGEETPVRIPIITSSRISSLRHNYINKQTQVAHDYEIVGYLSTTVLLDSGLDEDHETYADTRTKKHEFEAYDRMEGQAAQADVNSHAMDDGVIDSDEKKAIAKAHKRALEARHRGANQFKIVRTAKWSRDGLKSRLQTIKGKITGETKSEDKVSSEGKL